MIYVTINAIIIWDYNILTSISVLLTFFSSPRTGRGHRGHGRFRRRGCCEKGQMREAVSSAVSVCSAAIPGEGVIYLGFWITRVWGNFTLVGIWDI